jgi:hypothetical protein
MKFHWLVHRNVLHSLHALLSAKCKNSWTLETIASFSADLSAFCRQPTVFVVRMIAAVWTADMQGPPSRRTAAVAYHGSVLGGWRTLEFCHESRPRRRFEAQHKAVCCLAIADADAIACEAGGLEAVPIAHAV